MFSTSKGWRYGKKKRMLLGARRRKRQAPAALLDSARKRKVVKLVKKSDVYTETRSVNTTNETTMKCDTYNESLDEIHGKKGESRESQEMTYTIAELCPLSPESKETSSSPRQDEVNTWEAYRSYVDSLLRNPEKDAGNCLSDDETYLEDERNCGVRSTVENVSPMDFDADALNMSSSTTIKKSMNRHNSCIMSQKDLVGGTPTRTDSMETSPNAEQNLSDSQCNAYVSENTEHDLPTATDIKLEGRRIVDIQYVIDSIKSISRHEPFDCTFSDMDVISERRFGFSSVITFRCKFCSIIKTLRTECTEEKTGMMSVNAAAVSGTISVGGGYSQLEELCGALNRPCISKQTWKSNHDRISDTIHKSAWELMDEAAQEEAEIAILAGDIDEEGRPMIAVVADAAWSKRSYKSKYNSLAGVGCIVGFKTKKILFIGVRNKYCTVCERSSAKGTSIIPEHKCAKNWSGTFTSMEQDVIVEGFSQSLSMYGIIYSRLIADGDSSVHAKLVDAMPYGPMRQVEKIECRNHICRNYVTKVRDTCINTKISNNELRSALQSRIARLRAAVICAIKFRKKQSENDHHLSVEELRKDIINSPYHVLGDHSKCRERKYFCDGSPKLGEVNLVNEMKRTGLMQELMTHIQRVAKNATSLILDVDNNVAENFNSVVAKFNGGKRINFALANSYKTRCEAAVVSVNSSGELHRVIHKSALKKSPGIHTKNFIDRRKNRAGYQKRRRLIFPNRKKTENRKQSSADSDYGPQAAVVIPDMTQPEFENAKEMFLQTMKLEKKENIEKRTREQSSCHEWKVERSKRLTSSMFGRICKMKAATSCANVVKEIRYQVFKGNSSTCWGTEKEPVAIAHFESKNPGIVVRRCGLIVDEEFPFLGASPDGLIGDDEIIEVKCPSSAKLMLPMDAVNEKKINFLEIKNDTLQLKSSHNYMYQVQGLLHISRRQICHFVVWTPQGMVTLNIQRDKEFWKNQMLTKLVTFFNHCLLPEIIDPRHSRNMPIREPAYITEAQNAKKRKE